MDWASWGMESLATFGVGMVAILLVFGTVAMFLWKIPTFFQAWREMVKEADEERHFQLKAIADLTSKNSELTTLVTEVIRANTAAMHDSSKSNENVAAALTLLSAMYERSEKEAEAHDERVTKALTEQVKALADHDIKAQAIAITLASVNERTSACRTRRDDPK